MSRPVLDGPEFTWDLRDRQGFFTETLPFTYDSSVKYSTTFNNVQYTTISPEVTKVQKFVGPRVGYRSFSLTTLDSIFVDPISRPVTFRSTHRHRLVLTGFLKHVLQDIRHGDPSVIGLHR